MKLGTIWIGDDSKRPDKLIDSWKRLHPDWEYQLYDNDYLYGKKWVNQELLDQYLELKDYPGVADIMRYEILYNEELFLHPADSECLIAIDDLVKDRDIVTVYENEKVRPGLISPVYYAKKNHPFVGHLIEHMSTSAYDENGVYLEPWQNTGNLYMQKVYESREWGFKPLPSYTFNPVHFTGETYTGNGKIYARQMWHSTNNTY